MPCVGVHVCGHGCGLWQVGCMNVCVGVYGVGLGCGLAFGPQVCVIPKKEFVL